MTTKSYPQQPPRVPKLMAIVATSDPDPDSGYDVLYGLDTEGRVWVRVMSPGGLWRRVPEAADYRDR